MSLEIRHELSGQALLESVLGTNPSLSRARAINLVPSAQIPDREKVLRNVVENEGEDPSLRRLAAIGLWRVNTSEAREALLAAAKTVNDPTTLIGVVKSLGRVGDERALPLLERLRDRDERPLAEQASFAASLLSYRLGLPGNDLPVPSEFEKMPPSNQRSIQFVRPEPEEVERFFSSLGNEPYDIELSRESLRQVLCTGAVWMLALNQAFDMEDPLAILRKRKSVVGLLASRNPEKGSYSVGFLLLASPAQGRDHADFLIHRSTGDQAWAGVITSGGQGEATFAIHTAGRIGIVPIEMEGIWAGNGKLELTRAVSALRVTEKMQPIPLEMSL